MVKVLVAEAESFVGALDVLHMVSSLPHVVQAEAARIPVAHSIVVQPSKREQ
jgi:hypothetical protein